MTGSLSRFLMIIALAPLLIPAPLYAAKKVRSPYVSEGEWSLEHYGSYGFEHENSDDEYEYKSKSSIGYGVTDWWKVELEGILKNTPNNNTEYYATEFVNKFQFWEKGEYYLDMGLYTAYEKHRDSDKADVIEAIIIAAKDFGTSSHRANFIMEQEIGSNRSADLEWGVAWQSFWPVSDAAKLGFEYYGAYGEMNDMQSYAQQSHQIGPVVAFDIPHTEVEMKLGYLAGISSDAFDSTVKWELEWEF